MPSERKTFAGPWRAGSRLVLVAMVLLAGPISTVAHADSQGITQRTVFPPFDPNSPACGRPPGLAKLLGYVQENDRDFLNGVDHGLAMAAKNRGLEYRRLLADDDAGKAIDEIHQLLNAKAGGLIATSPDPAALAPNLQQVIWWGAFVGTIVPPPATLLLNAPQYETGKVLTDAAIAHITLNLGGKANVVLLTQDTMEYLAPRFEAMRDGLSKIPGVSIVADIAPKPVNKQGGYETMKTILLTNPKIDVVLGGDAVVLGALQALREAGKDRSDQFLGGIDGEAEAVAEIKKGDSAYKASISLSSPVFGYAMGWSAADWMEGKSVPQAMDILPIALTSSNIAQYEADLMDPASVYADPERRNAYLRMYGNICYDTRDRYVNFPWSSEQK
jgi:ribose transport system substrate-binding protein